MENKLSELVEILHREKCSCVISTDGRLTLCHERGVRDLYILLRDTPEILNGALIADKVIGKGAAALMILGRVREIYADVISRPALQLLQSADIPVSCGTDVPYIINRAGTGICPVETLCLDASTADECLLLISDFMNRQH